VANYESITPSGTRASSVRARKLANALGRPPIVKVGARETGLMAKVGAARDRGNRWLHELGWDEYRIDEVAIMLPEAPKEKEDWRNRMMDRVGREGVTYFNRSRSTVIVNSLPSKYDVEYHFFTSNVPGVRIELMDLGSGHSPLHALYNQGGDSPRGRDGCIVHASFKLSDEAVYRSALSSLAINGWVCGQDCSSDYGLFSYWRKPSDDESLLWLKPRVNLRDVPKQVLFSPEDQPFVPFEEDEEEYARGEKYEEVEFDDDDDDA
jgi:hypothetical protein